MKPLDPKELTRHLVRERPRVPEARPAFRRWALWPMVIVAVIAAFCALYGVEIVLSLVRG